MHDSAGDAARDAVRKLVTGGGYRPGDRLPPERELAQSLGLSRPTVREAIRRLIESGLLESRHGSGTYVADIDIDAVSAVRLQLEPYAAALAARTPQADVRARLGALIKVLSTQMNDPETFVATDIQIHLTLAEASGNPVLCDVLERLTDLAAVSRGITSPVYDARRATLRHLRAVVRAVRTCDPDAAAAAMEAHLVAVAEAGARETRVDRRIIPLSADTAA
jgi:GntR family transcriptional repressor for pyruvate dehydrogenase complex